MKKIATLVITAVAYVWAFPVTLVGLLFNGVLCLFRQVVYVRRYKLVVVWATKKDSWYEKTFWAKWAGSTIGACITLRSDYADNEPTFKHETIHVRQCYRLGVFQPLCYGLILAAIKLGCPAGKPYYDNPFEVEARREEKNG